MGALALTGCGAAGEDAGAAAGPTATAPAPPTTGPAAPPAGSGLADAVESLPPAPAVPEAAPAGATPVGLTVDALDVRSAPVTPVGVEDDGDMEIPGAREVGWYRFGPVPGDGGSSVLAAHIAYDGVDGVFRHLDDLGGGETVTVTLDDGSSRAFVVTEVAQYPKDELPDDVFARTGDARLVLVTCGGDFDAGARSYRDNVVAYAMPA